MLHIFRRPDILQSLAMQVLATFLLLLLVDGTGAAALVRVCLGGFLAHCRLTVASNVQLLHDYGV